MRGWQNKFVCNDSTTQKMYTIYIEKNCFHSDTYPSYPGKCPVYVHICQKCSTRIIFQQLQSFKTAERVCMHVCVCAHAFAFFLLVGRWCCIMTVIELSACYSIISLLHHLSVNMTVQEVTCILFFMHIAKHTVW
jgi:hypothetical protein